MAKDYIFGFNPTKVPESFERPDHIPEFIHGPRPNIVPSQDNKVISYYEEIIRLKRAMDALQSELEDIIRSQIPDYDISNANDVLSVNEDGTKMEWKPATSASGVSASVEQTETGATITITDASGTTTANIENGGPGEPGFSPSAKVEQTATGATITVTDKSGTTTADILNGKGEKGDPGFSPSASVTQTETGATVTVTDETGTTTAELKNGKDGVGIPGDDGFSPIANVQQTETGATVTVTDKTGTTTANITNGAPGHIGLTPSVTATATVNDSQGTPSVEVTKTGTDEAPAFNFAFSGLKGETGEGTKGDDGFSPIANVQQTETGATITVTDKSGTTTATVENGTPGKEGGPGPAGPGVPAGGVAGQVLAKKSGTDYDTEWVNQSGGSSGYITFGGKDGYFYAPRLEENLSKSYEDYRRNINESTSVNYFVNGAPVDDTLNINGVLKIPAGTPVEKILSYFIGGSKVIANEYDPGSYMLNKSDFTITLSSGNTLVVDSIVIINIKSSQPNPPDASIEISGSVGTEAAYLSASISLGQLFLMDQSDMKTYFLEPKK